MAYYLLFIQQNIFLSIFILVLQETSLILHYLNLSVSVAKRGNSANIFLFNANLSTFSPSKITSYMYMANHLLLQLYTDNNRMLTGDNMLIIIIITT